MQVSIVIPVYNAGEELRGMLDSVRAQTFRDFEAILVDDGSTDGSGAVCDEYARLDKRFRVVHQKNAGVSAARNRGMSEAAGIYLAFFDADDRVAPTALEKLLAAATKTEADIVCCDLECNGVVYKCNLDSSGPLNKVGVFNEVLPRFTKGGAIAEFCPVTKLYKRDLIEQNGIKWNEQISFQEDLMFTVEAIACCDKMAYVPEALYCYEQRAGGLCSSYRENAGEKFIYARKEFDKLIKKYKMVNLDIPNFNLSFLYNITYYIYRTRQYVRPKKRRDDLINSTLDDPLTKSICGELVLSSSSFDRRTAKAIAGGNRCVALWLINFVHSGKAARLQKLLSNLRGK